MKFGASRRLPCVAMSAVLFAPVALDAQPKSPTSERLQVRTAELQLDTDWGSIPIQMLSQFTTTMRDSSGVGQESFRTVLSATMLYNWTSAILDAESNTVRVYGRTGELVQEIRHRSSPTVSSSPQYLTSAARNEMFVYTTNDELFAYSLVGGKYQLNRRIPIASPLASMCYMNGWLVIARKSRTESLIVDVLELRNGELVRTLDSIPLNASSPRWEPRVSCDPGNDMVGLLFDKGAPQLRAYRIGGGAMWHLRVSGVSSTTAHRPRLVAFNGAGMLLQWPTDDGGTSHGSTRSELTILVSPSGTAVVDRNRWAPVLASQQSKVLWLCGNYQGIPKVCSSLVRLWVND